MRLPRIFLVAALATCITGCAQLRQVFDIGESITTGLVGVQSAVTPERLATAEYGAGIVFVSLNEYADNCEKGLVPVMGGYTCKQVYQKIRPYAIKAKAVLAKLRNFVDKNQQGDAVSAYNELIGIVNVIKNEAFIAGVPMKGA